MLDKNGVTIKAGDIVCVEGGYFKTDNGLFFVEQDGTNPSYLADDTQITLKRICKNGRLSTAKNATAFFPLKSFCSDYMLRRMAREWNEDHATIEVVGGVNAEHVAEWFLDKAENIRRQEHYYKMRDFSSDFVAMYANDAKWYEAVAERISA